MTNEVCDSWENLWEQTSPLPVSLPVCTDFEQCSPAEIQQSHLADALSSASSVNCTEISRHSSELSIDSSQSSQTNTSTINVAVDTFNEMQTSDRQMQSSDSLLIDQWLGEQNERITPYIHTNNMTKDHTLTHKLISDVTFGHDMASCEENSLAKTSQEILDDMTSVDPKPEEMIHNLTTNKTQYQHELYVNKGDESETPQPKVKKRRNRSKNPDPPPMAVLPPCKVCDDKATGYHYGVNTCEACKGFFRRTLKKKEVDFKCKCKPEERSCWKRGPYKNGCPACRYERCLDVGMSKNAIKIGRYTLNHKTDNIKEAKLKKTELHDVPVTNDSTSNDSTFLTVTESNTAETQATEYSNTVEDWILTALQECESESGSPFTMNNTNVASSESSNNLQSLESVDNVMKASYEIDDDVTELPPMARLTETVPPYVMAGMTLKEIDTIIKTITEAHKSIQFVEEIPKTEIKQRHSDHLEKYKLKTQIFGEMRSLTRVEYADFYKATGIDIDGRMAEVDDLLNYFEQRIAMLVAFAKAIPGFKHLPLDDQAELVKASQIENTILGSYRAQSQKVDYKKQVLITPWGKESTFEELTKFFPIELLKERHALNKKVLALDMSIEEEALLRALIITSPDRCCLQEPQKAEVLNEKMVCCLQHLLNVRHGGPGKRFYKTIDILSELRKLSETQSRFASDTMKMPLISHKMKNFTLIREMFSS